MNKWINLPVEKSLFELTAIAIDTDAQVEILRQIRNATAESFSHDTDYIDEDQQQQWWAQNHELGRIKAWLYEIPKHTIVGYGMLRYVPPENRWWNSLAIWPGYQGCGFGSIITADLLTKHDGPVYAAVRKTNRPALAMHHASDWDKIDGPDHKLVYFRSKK